MLPDCWPWPQAPRRWRRSLNAPCRPRCNGRPPPRRWLVVVASPLAAVALSVDVTDINSPPVVDLPVLGRFGVSPSKREADRGLGDLVGTAPCQGRQGQGHGVHAKIGPLPALDDEVLDIRIAVAGAWPALHLQPGDPKLPAGGGTSDWNVVQNLGSGATYYFTLQDRRHAVRQPRCSVAQAREKAAAPAVPAAAPAAATAVAAKAATQKKTPAPKKAAPPKREKVKGKALFKGEQKAAQPPKKAAAKKAESKSAPKKAAAAAAPKKAAGPAPSAPKIELPRKTKKVVGTPLFKK